MMSQFLSTLEVKKGLLDVPSYLETRFYTFFNKNILPPQSPQAALRFTELIPTTKMSKKILIK